MFWKGGRESQRVLSKPREGRNSLGMHNSEGKGSTFIKPVCLSKECQYPGGRDLNKTTWGVKTKLHYKE